MRMCFRADQKVPIANGLEFQQATNAADVERGTGADGIEATRAKGPNSQLITTEFL
jgi:hypothetical protein